MGRNWGGGTAQDFPLWGHSIECHFTDFSYNPRHIVFQSDEKGLRKVTKLLYILDHRILGL